MKTLVEFIQEQQAHIPNATGEFSRLIHDIGIAAKYVNREVNKAGLADILGFDGGKNVQGEDQVKLDVFANNHFIHALEHGGQCCAMVSEETEGLITFGNSYSNKGKYVVAFDPIDGSSNVDVNVPIGSIFAIYKRKSESGPGTIIDVLQQGNQMVAAGYVMYGMSTILVYAAGQGVNAFTYEPSLGMFLLSHSRLRYPVDGTIYSINEANYIYFSEGVKHYIKYCQEDDPATHRPYGTRYIGSLVSDFHRNLIRGGIFIYPGTKKNPNGKLRLLYECNPMAYLAEQAGGMATDGFQRILDIQPQGIHDRTPIFIGSRNMVSKAGEFMEKYG